MHRRLLLAACLAVGFASAQAQDLTAFEQKVTEFTLTNGLKVIVIRRDAAPVASFVTFVNAGSANEPVGYSGIAHVFEHMAFKGSTVVGTTDWTKEKPALMAMEQAYVAWLNEKAKVNANPEAIKAKWDAFKAAEAEAKRYVKNNEFSELVDLNGGQGMNASTFSDKTVYYYSLPQNKAELWFALEAARFRDPVMREFYVEKDVVKEERRQRTESNPVGRMIEEFLMVAYSGHPYAIPGIGFPSDIDNTTMAAAQQFFETFYVPSNMTICIAGDVDPAEMKRLAEKYLGPMPAGRPAPALTVAPTPQRGERRFSVVDQSQPLLVAGYHTVDANHPDAEVLNLLASILSDGRTSRLYKRMVTDEAKALAVGAFNGFPGDKYPSMFLTYVFPNQGVGLDECEKIMNEEIEKAKKGEITQEELDRVRTNERAGLIRSLDNNLGLANALAEASMKNGDWRYVFKRLDKMKAVTLDDLKRVANTYLVAQNRTVGTLKNAE